MSAASTNWATCYVPVGSELRVKRSVPHRQTQTKCLNSPHSNGDRDRLYPALHQASKIRGMHLS
ncbi:MAG: hypothetical protein AAFY15_03385 [Cyanobacteria bacterium J06648_11]